MQFIVRQALESDIPQIICFIKEYWCNDHIFVKNDKFFRYMLCDDQGVNVIVAVDKENKIYGLEGVTFYNSTNTPDSSGMMWRCLKTDDIFLGIRIDQYMKTYRHQRFHFGVGSNPDTTLKITEKYYKNLSGKLDHFYRLNGRLSDYKIAKIKTKNIIQPHTSNKQLVKIESKKQLRQILTDNLLRQYTPYKDIDYLTHRYFEHPIFRYNLYGILADQQEASSILVTRVVPIAGRSVIKIIDFIGRNEDLSGLAPQFDALMFEENSEYIDIYSLGISEQEMNDAGLIKRIDEEAIIPNYFEPFEQKNVDIYYTVPYLENVKLFRGDADQDRPNFIRGI